MGSVLAAELITSDVDLKDLAKVVSAGILHCNATNFLLLSSVLWKSVHTP